MTLKTTKGLSTVLALAILFTACAAPAPAAPAPKAEAPAAAAATTTPEATAALVEVAATATPAPAQSSDLAGDISINFQSNDKQTWDAVAKAYAAKHPNVKVTVDLKPNEGYQEYIRAQFAGGTPKASLVNGNVVADLMNDKKFLALWELP